jgi:hypothetical protein
MRNYHRLMFAVPSLIIFICVDAHGATPEEYKKVAGEQHCKSIPDSATASQCRDRDQDISDYCKVQDDNGDKLGCKQLSTLQMVQTIQDNKTAIGKLSDEKRDLDSKRDRASEQSEKDDLAKQIAEKSDKMALLNRQNEDLERKVADFKSIALGKANRWERCAENRSKINDIYRNAEQRAKDDLGSGDADIKSIAPTLIAHWQSEEETHKTAKQEALNAQDRCKRVAAGEE